MKWKKNIFLFIFLCSYHNCRLLSKLRQTIFRPLSFIPMELAFTREVTGCWKAPLAQLLPESVKRSGSVVFGSQLRICVWAGEGGCVEKSAGRNLRSSHRWTVNRWAVLKARALPFHNWFPRQSNGFLNCSTERGRLITVSPTPPNSPRIISLRGLTWANGRASVFSGL